jgi:L-malate glycosyltransferase
VSDERLRLAFLSIGRHIHTERWLTWFARRGHDVHLMTVQPGPIPGVTVHDITPPPGPKPLRYAMGLITVKRVLARLRPSLLHAHFLTGYGYWGVWSGYRPFLVTVWGDDVYVTPHQTVIKNRLARKALREADYVTGDSEDIIEACRRLGARADRTEVVQWGVDFALFHPGVPSGRVREKLGVPANAPIVLSTRSFTQPYYNIDLIVDTAVRVRELFPDVHYVFAGNEGDDAAFKARSKGADWMHWVGRIPHPELPAWIGAATVFVTVPSVDATAVSLLEAMACRAAIVASDLPSAREWIRDGETGLVVKARDESGLVRAIERFLSDAALRERVGRGAEGEVRTRADHDRNMQRMEDIYIAFAKGRVPAPLEVDA